MCGQQLQFPRQKDGEIGETTNQPACVSTSSFAFFVEANKSDEGHDHAQGAICEYAAVSS